jgi:threonine dehydrogenase-like Zn-dependent dehydrogenase
VSLIDAPPPVETPERLRVKVAACGICGSDFHIIGWKPKITLGHEVSGYLEDGTPVAIWPREPCWTCEHCREGRVQLCVTGPGTLGVRQDGGMADEVTVAPSGPVPLPANVVVEDACLVEPIACVLHGLNRVEIKPLHRVAVIGGGTIGLVAAAATAWLGCDVGVSARYPHQKAAAERLGAHVGLSGKYDLVIDAAGSAQALATGFDALRPTGTVLLLGTYWDPVEFPALFCNLEPTIVGAVGHSRQVGGRDADGAVTLLSNVPELAPTLITHRFGLDEVVRAFEVAEDRKSGAIKVVLQP